MVKLLALLFPLLLISSQEEEGEGEVTCTKEYDGEIPMGYDYIDTLEYDYDFDENGLFYQIGTMYGDNQMIITILQDMGHINISFSHI